jgi:hypothetical protein
MLIPMLVLDYELRKEYIIKVYCVNKDRPELHCDGKCYLAEKIAQSKERDEKQAMNSFLTQVFSMESFTEFPDFSLSLITIEFSSEKEDNFSYKAPFSNPPFASFFTPPRASVA